MVDKIKLINESMGSFLEPPTHPTHKSSYKIGTGRNAGAASLNAEGFKNRKDNPLRDWKPLPYNNQKIKKWEKNVYGYFGNCYSPDGKTRDVSKAICTRKKQPLRNHLGFMHVRSTYPNASPKKSLITRPPKW